MFQNRYVALSAGVLLLSLWLAGAQTALAQTIADSTDLAQADSSSVRAQIKLHRGFLGLKFSMSDATPRKQVLRAGFLFPVYSNEFRQAIGQHPEAWRKAKSAQRVYLVAGLSESLFLYRSSLNKLASGDAAPHVDICLGCLAVVVGLNTIGNLQVRSSVRRFNELQSAGVAPGTLNTATVSDASQPPPSSLQRKGFIWALGVGAGHTSYLSENPFVDPDSRSDRQNHRTLITDFRLGYALNPRLLLYYQNKVSWFRIEQLSAFSSSETESVLTITGLMGVGVSYTPASFPQAIMLHGSAGLSVFRVFRDSDFPKGPAASLGVSYAVSPRAVLDFDVIYGKPGENFTTINTRTFALSLTRLNL
jgi:hypothetical protein